MEIHYGPACPEDIQEITAFAKALVDRYEDLEKIPYQRVVSWLTDKVRENLPEYHRIYAGEQLAGFYRFHPAEGKMELDDLYLYPPYRGKGIGTAVIRKCLEESGRRPVFLYVFVRNTGAIRLYQRLGFQVVQNVGETRYIMEYQKEDW